MRARCGRDADEMRTRCGRDESQISRDAGEMRARCERDEGETRARCERDAVQMRARCARLCVWATHDSALRIDLAPLRLQLHGLLVAARTEHAQLLFAQALFALCTRVLQIQNRRLCLQIAISLPLECDLLLQILNIRIGGLSKEGTKQPNHARLQVATTANQQSIARDCPERPTKSRFGGHAWA
eukprot:6192045-Pleurochrysis_carterae.AAC.1